MVWLRSLFSALKFKWESPLLPESRRNASFFRAIPIQTRRIQGWIVKWTTVIFPAAWAPLALTLCWASPLPSPTHTDLWPTLDCLVGVINARQPCRWFSLHISLLCWVTLLCFNEIYWDTHLESPRRSNLLLLKKVLGPGFIQPHKVNSFRTNLYNCCCLPKTYEARVWYL